MQPDRVIEGFRLAVGAERLAAQEVLLERGEDALGDGVIETVALGADAPTRTVRTFRAPVPLRSTEWESGRAAARRATILEACCFVGAAGGVAGAVRMSAGAR